MKGYLITVPGRQYASGWREAHAEVTPQAADGGAGRPVVESSPAQGTLVYALRPARDQR